MHGRALHGDRFYLIGDGGHARSVRATLQRIGAVVVDGRTGALPEYPYALEQEGYRHVAVGDPEVRRSNWDGHRPRGAKAIVDPFAIVDATAAIMGGVFVGARAYVGPNVVVMAGAIINTGAVIEHDATVGPFSFVGPLAGVMGGAAVGKMAYIGAGAIILPGVAVGDNAIIGAGAVVRSNVPAVETWAGVPARKVR